MKVHIIGQAGSGKTTLARQLAASDGATAHDLDPIVYGPGGQRSHAEVARSIEVILTENSWVTEGAYRDAWLTPLLDAADAIVWLDLPRRVCLWRIFRRHVLAELRRNNRHPGWRRLASFMRYTWEVHPRLRAETAELLAGYGEKVVRCRSAAEVSALGRSLRADYATKARRESR